MKRIKLTEGSGLLWLTIRNLGSFLYDLSKSPEKQSKPVLLCLGSLFALVSSLIFVLAAMFEVICPLGSFSCRIL